MKDSSKINVWYFILWIIIAIGVSVGIYYFNRTYHLGIDSTMTGYVGLIAAPSTAYLWIVRERKKEKELENKREDQYQERISELNKVYVEGVNQLYDENKQLAGAFTLVSLIDEWYYLSKIYLNHTNDINIKIEQIVSVLFSRYEQIFTDEPSLFNELIKDVIVKVVKSQRDTQLELDWSKFTFNNLSFGLNENEYPGIEMKYKNSFEEANLFRSRFIESDFSSLNLQKMTANKAVFGKSFFNNSDLNKSTFIESQFRESYFMGASLIGATLHDSTFLSANLSKAKLINADLTEASFKFADLSGADLRRATLRKTDFTGASLRGAKLDGAIIEGTYFNGADISNIDLSGEEFQKAEIYGLSINGKAIDADTEANILSGNLQEVFKR